MNQKKMIEIKKYCILLEQVAFSAFSFILVGVLGKFSATLDYITFIKSFSLSSLLYGVITSCLSQGIIVTYLNNRSRSYASKSITFEILVVITLISILSLIINSLGSDLYEVIIFIFFSFGWTVLDLLRKLNFVVQEEIKNITMTAVFYTMSLMGYFLILYYFDFKFIHTYKYVPIVVGMSLTVTAIIFVYSYINVFCFDMNIVKSLYEYAKPFILGAVFFWVYSQGVYIFLTEVENKELISKIRVSQNLTGLISIFLIYFENKYIAILGTTNDCSLSRFNVIDKVENNYKKNLFQFLFISILILIVSTTTVYYIYGYGLQGVKLVSIFIVMNYSLMVVRPYIVAFKIVNKGSYIMKAHFFAVITSVFIGILSYYNKSEWVLIVWVIVPYFSFSYFIWSKWLGYQKKYSSH